MQELTLRVKQNPGTIELNFDELNAQMDARLAEYKGAIFTEDSKDIAKAEVASLRRLQKDVDDTRKAVKKEWMKPLEAFEANMKKLSSKADEPINLINDQLEEFEKKRRVEKKKKIQDIYENSVGDMEEYLPLEKIYDIKWENATTTIKSIRGSIEAAVDSTKVAVTTISGMQSDAVEKALQLYKNTLDMAKAIAYINDYERQKAEIIKREEERRRQEEERQRQAEIDRARAAERKAVMREEQIRKEAVPAVAAPSPDPASVNPFLQPEDDEEDGLPFVQPTTVAAFYKVVATSQELEDVEMAFNSMGIYFERRDA